MNCRARFLSQLVSREVSENANGGRGLFDLAAPLGFFSCQFMREVWAPTGTRTDFSSIPRLPFIWLVLGDRYRKPAAIHDRVYDTHEVPRWVADALLLEMCTVVDSDIRYRWAVTRAMGKCSTWARRHAMWLGVRLFGWSHW